MTIQPTAPIKIVLVGDYGVGKTTLISTYLNKKFPNYKYPPCEPDSYTVKLDLLGETLEVQILDTAGEEEFASIRKLNYTGADVVLMCYNSVSQDSFNSLEAFLHPEIAEVIPDAAVVLVGTKADLKESNPENVVSKKDCKKLASKLLGSNWVECSALWYDEEPVKSRVRDVFNIAIRFVIQKRGYYVQKCFACSIL